MKSWGDRPVGKFDDALVDAPKKLSNGMRCNESDEFTPGKSSSLETTPSNSQDGEGEDGWSFYSNANQNGCSGFPNLCKML
ncbi:hypothetical protein ACS0TY_014029 [Phlomoides rotata]